ncbi:MAG: hypothetical protein K9H61_07420, partial [Bacteroidia bacterium]|nr:hypothetical protein [Bacteroidia bacterium]
MKMFYYLKRLFTLTIGLLLLQQSHAQLITIGTGTSTNTGTSYPAPYGNYYWGARHQYLILASEIASQGVTSGKLTSLALNVATSTSSQGLITCSTYPLSGFTIKVKETSVTSITTFDDVGLVTVHGPLTFTDVAGWNTHVFSSPFTYTGGNLLVDICFNNSCYNYNSQTYFSTTTFTSCAYRYQDAAGNCTNTATSSSTSRANMRLNFLPSGSGPVLPPIANFYPSQATVNTIPNDTVWINSPYNLVATSTNTTRNYWDLPNVSSLPFGYSRQNVGWTSQQYIDTAKYDSRFKYTFPNRGFVPVRLLAINALKRDSLRDSVVKYIWVDTPNTTPKPNFFAARRKIGIGDYASLVDITSNGPFQWYWTYTPACNLCTTPPYFNNFFAGPTDQNPLFFGGDPGKFTVCLQAWNDRGWDTICKPDYIEVLNSINMCSGSGSDKSSEQEGFIFAASGPGLSYTRSQLNGCPGLLLEPCADSIILWVDRMKMLPTDSLVIHNGTSASAPIIKTIGGSNVNQLPTSILQNGIRGGSRIFVRFKLGTGNPTLPYDSAGFSIRWEAMPASYPKPTSIMIVPDSIFSLQPVLFNSASVGTLMQYSWDTDGNGVYDSAGATATRSFLITAPQYKKICLVTYNCVGSDTTCKNVLFLPTTQKPVTRFEADKIQGFNTDTFRFTDK